MIIVTGNITGNLRLYFKITAHWLYGKFFLYVLANNNAQCIVNADYIVSFYSYLCHILNWNFDSVNHFITFLIAKSLIII